MQHIEGVFLHECRPTGKKGMFHVPLLGQKQLAIQGPSQRGKLQWTPSRRRSHSTDHLQMTALMLARTASAEYLVTMTRLHQRQTRLRRQQWRHSRS
jgi:hypothetical protein